MRLAGFEEEAADDGDEGLDALVGAAATRATDTAAHSAVQIDSLVLDGEELVINSGLQAE